MARLKPEQPVAADNVANAVLHRLEAHCPARLALEVVDDGSERLEIGAAAEFGAMVQRLLVWGAIGRVPSVSSGFDQGWDAKRVSTYGPGN